MSVESKTTLKGYFNTGDTPTEAQFANLIDTMMALADFAANVQSLLAAADYAAIRTLLDLEIGTDVQAYDVDTAKLDTAQTWAAVGQTGTEHNLGTISAASTVTLDFANGNYQRAVNGGAFTLQPPASGVGVIQLSITNNGSAGAVTTSAFDVVRGSFTTTDANAFECTISCTTAGKSLTIGAMQ